MSSSIAMQEAFGIHSIRYKLSVGVLMTTILALLIFSIVVVFYDLTDFRQRTLNELRAQADVIGEASLSSLQSHNSEATNHLLSALQVQPNILSAAVYLADGQILGLYHSGNKPQTYTPSILPQVEHIDLKLGQLSIPRPVVKDGHLIGTVYLLAQYPFYHRLSQDIAVVLAVAVMALLISMLMSLWIQSHITRPIESITKAAHNVVEHQDYQQRLRQNGRDEIAYLIDAFNNMLSVIGQRTQDLKASNRQLNKEVAQRTFAQEALRNSEMRLRTLVTALSSVVWRADKAGQFQAEQPQWQLYTGQSSGEYTGNGWMQAFESDDQIRLTQLWQPNCSIGKPFELQLKLWHAASKQYRHINLRAVPVLDDLGKPKEWMGIVDDIHELISTNQELKTLNNQLESRVMQRTAELENANKELEAFSYSVSHDLRAPLRSIDGFSQALLEDYQQTLDETGQDYLNRVRLAAQRMGQLIDDLLDLSRVSRAEMYWEQLDMSAIATQIIAELRDSEANRQVAVDIDPELKAYGDARLIKIVLTNLLDNAWKYSSHRADSSIAFSSMSNDDGEKIFFIKDNGAGFDMQQAHRLFGAFQRLHDAREFSGTGVGLATVQRIIHRHQGKIWAKAELNNGATFYFTLPTNKE